MFGLEIDVAGLVNYLVDAAVSCIGSYLRSISNIIEDLFELIVDAILIAPPITIIIPIGLFLWWVTNRKIALGGVITLAAISLMGHWEAGINTIVLVLLSTLLSLIFSLPIGITMGVSDRFESIMKPVLDFMQTMPAFVYLIPAVMFFGVGKVPAISATLIFAMPPPIRLTNLGIRGVPPEVKEAAISFGATRKMLLFDVELPLAIPTIMAGVNQCIMLALSMAVIASMIGAAGLGGEVLRGINRLDVGHGFEAGIAIVAMAIVIDRTASAVHNRYSNISD